MLDDIVKHRYYYYYYYENDLLLLSIRNKLLPLILKEEVLQTDFWTTVDSGLVESTMHEIVSDIRQHHDDALSEILGTAKEAVSPNTKSNSNICSALKKYNVPLDDTRVHQSLLKDLYYLNKKRHGTTTLQCDLGDNRMSSFVFVPSCKDHTRVRKNVTKTKWLVNVLLALGGPGNEHDSLLNLLTYIG